MGRELCWEKKQDSGSEKFRVVHGRFLWNKICTIDSVANGKPLVHTLGCRDLKCLNDAGRWTEHKEIKLPGEAELLG